MKFQSNFYFNNFKIEEEFEEEEDEGLIEKKINSFKHKINEKTSRIIELKESLKKTMQM